MNGNIDQLPTLVNLSAVHLEAPAPYFIVEAITIDHQATWIIPAARKAAGAPKSASRSEGAESYCSVFRNLIKNSGIYALSSLASPLISLVLAPLLTRNLTHADYGALAVLNTIIALVAGITQLGINAAFFRVYNFDYESESDRLRVLSTVVALLSLITIPTVIAGLMLAPWLASMTLGSASFSVSIQLASLVILAQNFSVPGLVWLRAKHRAEFYSLLSIANLITNAGITIVLVGIMHMGIIGALMAVGAGYALMAICTLPLILARAGIHLRFTIASGLLSFGLPHLANLVSGWVLQLSDRYLLGHLASLSETASYAVAYSLGGILSAVVIAPFSLAWWSMMYTIAKRNDAKRVFELVFRWFSLLLLFATFGFSLLGIIMLDTFFPPAYHVTAPVIPIIALSTMFYGAYGVVTIGISLQRKTWIAAILFTSSALLNVGINIILIPFYGAMGAAIATLIAYAALAMPGYLVNQWLYPVSFHIGRFLIALLLGLVLYFGSDSLAQGFSIYMAWAIHIGSLALYGACLVALGMIPVRDRNKTHT